MPDLSTKLVRVAIKELDASNRSGAYTRKQINLLFINSFI